MKKLYSFLTILLLIFSLSSMNGLENDENEINIEEDSNSKFRPFR